MSVPNNDDPFAILASGQSTARFDPRVTDKHRDLTAPQDKRMSDNWEAYERGTATPALNEEQDGADYSITFGLPSMIVDTYNDWLTGNAPYLKVVCDCATNEQDDPCVHQQEFEKSWPVSQQKLDFERMRTVGGVTGHSFVKNLPPKKDRNKTCKAVILDSAKVTVKTDPEDYQVAISISLVWAELNDANQTIYHKQTHKRIQTPMTDGSTKTTWEIKEEEAQPGQGFKEVRTIPWPYELCQISNNPNIVSPCKFWGQSDFDPNILNLAAAIDRAASNVQAILSKSADPFLVTFGLSDSGQRAIEHRQVGSVAHFKDKTTQGIELVEIQAGAIVVAIEFLNSLRSSLFTTTGIPDPEKAVGRVGPMTAAEAELRESGRIAHINALRTTYESGLMERGATIRMYLDQANWQDGIEVIWQPLFPTDEGAAVTKAAALQGIGASKRTVFITAELDPDEEFKNIKDENAAVLKPALGEEVMGDPSAPAPEAPADDSGSMDDSTNPMGTPAPTSMKPMNKPMTGKPQPSAN